MFSVILNFKLLSFELASIATHFPTQEIETQNYIKWDFLKNNTLRPNWAGKVEKMLEFHGFIASLFYCFIVFEQ